MNIAIEIHTRSGFTTYRVACEEHVAVAGRAIFGEEQGPFGLQEPTGKVWEVDEPCLVCEWIEQHQTDPLQPIIVRPKRTVRQNIVTEP